MVLRELMKLLMNLKLIWKISYKITIDFKLYSLSEISVKGSISILKISGMVANLFSLSGLKKY